MHSGIDDVLNIFAILRNLIENGFVLDNTSSVSDDMIAVIRSVFGKERKKL